MIFDIYYSKLINFSYFSDSQGEGEDDEEVVLIKEKSFFDKVKEIIFMEDKVEISEYYFNSRYHLMSIEALESHFQTDIFNSK